MTVFTYLIKSTKDSGYYVGVSTSPARRLSEHNAGKLCTSAAKRPWELVYYKERQDYAEARKHEKWLKKKSRTYKDFLAQLAPPWDSGGVK